MVWTLPRRGQAAAEEGIELRGSSTRARLAPARCRHAGDLGQQDRALRDRRDRLAGRRFGAEVAYQMQRHCMDALDAPIERVTSDDVPMPLREEPRGRGPAAIQRHRRRVQARAVPGVAHGRSSVCRSCPTMEEGVPFAGPAKEGDKVSPGDPDRRGRDRQATWTSTSRTRACCQAPRQGRRHGQARRAGRDHRVTRARTCPALVEQANKERTRTPPAPKAPRAARRPPHRRARRPAQGKAPRHPPPAQGKGPPPRRRRRAPPRVVAAHAQTTQAPAARLLASPLAKTLAIELGLDLRTKIQGSGPGGGSSRRRRPGPPTALAPAAPRATATRATPPRRGRERPRRRGPPRRPRRSPCVTTPARPRRRGPTFEDLPASNMRKRIAARLTEAKARTSRTST